MRASWSFGLSHMISFRLSESLSNSRGGPIPVIHRQLRKYKLMSRVGVPVRSPTQSVKNLEDLPAHREQQGPLRGRNGRGRGARANLAQLGRLIQKRLIAFARHFL
jgi:hypothetical protein